MFLKIFSILSKIKIEITEIKEKRFSFSDIYAFN